MKGVVIICPCLVQPTFHFLMQKMFVSDLIFLVPLFFPKYEAEHKGILTFVLIRLRLKFWPLRYRMFDIRRPSRTTNPRNKFAGRSPANVFRVRLDRIPASIECRHRTNGTNKQTERTKENPGTDAPTVPYFST